MNRGYRFEPVTDKIIRYGWGGERHGSTGVEALVAAREGRGYWGLGSKRGLQEPVCFFCVWTAPVLNKRTPGGVIKAGAFDTLAPQPGSVGGLD